MPDTDKLEKLGKSTPTESILDDWLEPLEPFFKWLDKHAVTSVASFAIGWLLAVLTVYMDKGPVGNLINMFIAFGTLAAAIAALSTARSAREERERQTNLEREEKRPNLILTKISLYRSLETGKSASGDPLSPHVRLFFTATNLSQRAVVIRDVMFDSDFITEIGSNIPERGGFEKLIAPDASEELFQKFYITYDVHQVGCVVFSFQYGATGPVFHTMVWRFDVVTREDGTGDKFMFALSPTLYEGKGYDQTIYDQVMREP